METQQPKFLFKQILRKVFLEDWVMKVVALAITLALWFGVTGLSKPTTQRLTSIPLSVRYSNNIEVTNSPIQEINLVVSGDSRRLAQIESNLVASIDISEVAPGDKVIPLTPETVSVTLPTGVRLDEIQPRSMAVRIEAVEEKEVPVRAETLGALPTGYEVYGETVVPAKVVVRGPSSFMRSLEYVSTERIDITDRLADFTARQVSVSVSNPKAILRDSLVDVVFRIGERRIERVFMVPIDDGNGRRVRVVLYGGRSVLEDIDPAGIKITLVKNDAGRDTPRVDLPDEIEGKVEIKEAAIRS